MCPASCLICGTRPQSAISGLRIPLFLKGGQVSYACLVGQLMQAATVSNGLAHLGHHLVGDIHGEAPTPPPTVKRVVRVELTGSAGRTVRANAAAPPQRERSDRHRPHLAHRFDKPGLHTLRCLVSHVRMLIYMRTAKLANTFLFGPSSPDLSTLPGPIQPESRRWQAMIVRTAVAFTDIVSSGS